MRPDLGTKAEIVRRLALLVLLYSVPLKAAIRPVVDPDIWCHLRTGQWILEHGTVPRVDPFSIYGMGKSWVAYSWLFDLSVYGLYQVFGLAGMVLYTTVLSLLIALALHGLVRRFALSFGEEVLLTATSLAAMMPLFSPRSWLISILFFIVEFDVILKARQSGSSHRLWLLPPLFILWANVHIQFAYGLFLLGLAAVEPLIDEIFRHVPVSSTANLIPFRRWLQVVIVCAGATLITPYHFHLYSTMLQYMRETGVFRIIVEFQPLGFRDLSSWLVLFTALAAAFCLGWKREVRPLPLLALITGAFLSFRAVRDLWFIAVTAVLIIATTRAPADPVRLFPLTRRRAVLVSAALVIVLIALGWRQNISPSHLESVAAENYPAAAATIVDQRGYQGPLYNDYGWGSYLFWRLQSTLVSIDNRTNVHEDARIQRSVETWAGLNHWDADPELRSARLVIANVRTPLSSLLRLDSRFELVYEDKIAAVFIRRTQESAH